jgi:hypothetical protein
MPDEFQTAPLSQPPDTGPTPQPPDLAGQFPPLPAWLADRLLRADEKVNWVVGPKFNPSWERYVTHPALFLAALALGALCVAAGWLVGGGEGTALAGLAAGGIALAAIFVLGIFSGYFTRLVVTDARLLILQGYEVCSSWGMDDLPLSLVRYRTRGIDAGRRTVDLDALKTLLGTTSDKVVEAKTILAFGKKLEQIKSRENDRP